MKFNKHHVTNGTIKVKVSYHLDNRADKRQCVTMYAKDYDRNLGVLFPEQYVNNTDSMTDYFEKGRVVLFDDHPHYAAARARAVQNDSEWRIKSEQRRAKWVLPSTQIVSV